MYIYVCVCLCLCVCVNMCVCVFCVWFASFLYFLRFLTSFSSSSLGFRVSKLASCCSVPSLILCFSKFPRLPLLIVFLLYCLLSRLLVCIVHCSLSSVVYQFFRFLMFCYIFLAVSFHNVLVTLSFALSFLCFSLPDVTSFPQCSFSLRLKKVYGRVCVCVCVCVWLCVWLYV